MSFGQSDCWISEVSWGVSGAVRPRGEGTRGEDPSRDCRGPAVTMRWRVGRIGDAWPVVVREEGGGSNRDTITDELYT